MKISCTSHEKKDVDLWGTDAAFIFPGHIQLIRKKKFWMRAISSFYTMFSKKISFKAL